MNLVFEEYLKVLQTLHDEINKELKGLTAEALDWEPAEGTNSLSVLVIHVAGSERYWIGDVVLEETSHRNREAEFRSRGLTAEELTSRLEASMNYARSALARLDLADFERPRTAPRDGRRVSAAWALMHVLEHTGQHLGHIQLTRQLLDLK